MTHIYRQLQAQCDEVGSVHICERVAKNDINTGQGINIFYRFILR